MGSRLRRRSAIVTTALGLHWVLTGALPAPATAGNAETFHYTVDGVAEVVGSTCPFGDWTPSVATACEDWVALLYRTSPTPGQHNRVPWRLELIRAGVVVHPNGDVDVVWEAYGIGEDIEATFDERHLRFATVRASVPMSDGSTRHVDLAWDGSATPLRTDGNHGPFNQANDVDRHYVDRCYTMNAHAHQTYRANVAATGTIDGTAVDDFPYLAQFDPFLGRGHFNVVFVRHGGCDT